MKFKNQILLCITFIVLIIISFFSIIIFPLVNWDIFNGINLLDKFIDMLFLFIPVLVAYMLYLQSERAKERERLRNEINSINITLKEIEKNNQWCKEYIDQGIQPSIKFYNLTKVGIERCLNTLNFKNEQDFLEAFYMSIKLINIVNNVIEANIISRNNLIIELNHYKDIEKENLSKKSDGKITSIDNFNVNLVNMSNKSIEKSEILKVHLIQRKRENIKKIKYI